MDDRQRSAALLLASLLAHWALYLALGTLPSLEAMLELRRSEVDIEVEMEEPPPEAPAPVEEPPAPEPEPEPVIRPRPAATTTPPEPEPTPEPPPAQEEAIADFTGETLTNDDGAAWQSEVGSGAPMVGPIGQPRARVTGRRREGRPDGVAGGSGTGEPDTVPLSDLSEPPRQPESDLRDLLLRHYRETAAHRLGVEGRASVRVRVGADGRVRPIQVLSESYEGFGEACMRTLRSSPAWHPPRDRSGSVVATLIRYTCTFSMRY